MTKTFLKAEICTTTAESIQTVVWKSCSCFNLDVTKDTETSAEAGLKDISVERIFYTKIKINLKRVKVEENRNLGFKG